MAKAKSRLVYATDRGRVCPICNHAQAQCVCTEEKIIGNGNVQVRYETKGRKGKGVTIVSGLPLKLTELKELAKTLKRRIGSGGSVKDGCIEIQGDWQRTIKQQLKEQGWI